jgi:hypothetical protein
MLQHPAGHVTGDSHQGGVGCAGFGHFGNGLVAKIVEA